MKYEHIFNEFSLNLFVDGSVHHHLQTKETIGCPGGVIVVTPPDGDPYEYDEFHSIRRNSTNNDTEISAIYLGLNEVLNYIKHGNPIPKNINIFSDSQICIKGLTEWVFSWCRNLQNGIMHSSSGDEVKNQEIFKHIFFLILDNQLNINFFHQKGHVTSTNASLKNAVEVFKTSNHITAVDDRLVYEISQYNNYVDQFTKDILDRGLRNGLYEVRPPEYSHPIYYSMEGFDAKSYKALITKKFNLG